MVDRARHVQPLPVVGPEAAGEHDRAEPFELDALGHAAVEQLRLGHVRPLEPARDASPWYWAIRSQPVTEGVPVLGCLALLAVTVALVVIGTVVVERRDIRAA